MSLSIYHGNEEWILKGFGVDFEKSINKLFPSYNVQRFETFTNHIGETQFHFFVQQGQLKSFVEKNGTDLLSKSICIFTHFDIRQFPVQMLNRCFAILFMSSSQLSVAVANGLDSSRCFVVPIGVDQDMHVISDPGPILAMQNRQFNKSFSGRNAVGFCLRYWNKPAYTRRKRYKFVMNVVKILSEHLEIPVIVLGPGWNECSFSVRNNKVVYIEAGYKHYPKIYNMMKVFCSLSLHEGGPIPLLESMSCGVRPVVTNTGYTFDVLGGNPSEYAILSVTASVDEVIKQILCAYGSPDNFMFHRKFVEHFSFDNAARKLVSMIQ